MNNNIKKGKLKRWDDNKGFGFISSPGGGGDVFLHISAFKRAGRRPAMGDTISYQIHTDNKGKTRAVNARIDGVSASKSRLPKKPFKHEREISLTSQIMLVCLVALLGLFAYRLVIDSSLASEKSIISVPSSLPVAMKKSAPPSRFSCDGKVHCSEMDSCDEAIFYQRNCPGTKMDGDRDGAPCEKRCPTFLRGAVF